MPHYMTLTYQTKFIMFVSIVKIDDKDNILGCH